MGKTINITDKRVWVAGHRGMVGSAILRRLEKENCHVLTAHRDEVDLRRQSDVEAWMEDNNPDLVFLVAGKVGGIHANNSYPADFLYDNLMIEANIMRASANIGVQKLLFLGSSCIYPKEAEQPIREQALLSGPLEKTNEWYALAKIAGIKLCEAFRIQYGLDFISAMPTNLYGPGDNFHPENSHVPAALLRRFDEATRENASSVSVWGTGTVRREFMHVDDLADACVYVMKHYSDLETINIGIGKDISISEFAKMISEVVGFKGDIKYDVSKPDGTMRKLLDITKLKSIGWESRISLRGGLLHYYDWFLANQRKLRQ